MHTKYGVHSTPIWCVVHTNMVCCAHQYGVLCTPIYVCCAHQKWCAQHTLYGVPVWTVLAHQIWCAYHTKFFRVYTSYSSPYVQREASTYKQRPCVGQSTTPKNDNIRVAHVMQMLFYKCDCLCKNQPCSH